MSTIILGRLSRPAPSTDKGQIEGASDADDKKHWAEALAAVIPGEALALYTAMIAVYTVKGEAGGAASLSHHHLVRILSVGILLLIPVMYTTNSGGFKATPHLVRWFMAIVAFAAWLWLLPLSVWDTFKHIDTLDGAVRAGVGLFAAGAIVTIATLLFKKFPVPPAPPAT